MLPVVMLTAEQLAVGRVEIVAATGTRLDLINIERAATGHRGHQVLRYAAAVPVDDLAANLGPGRGLGGPFR
jgi:hypothetical protein